jgi:hypothetical protein
VNGPEHYLHAQTYATEAATDKEAEWMNAHAALAQVHATLALAAAIAEFGDTKAGVGRVASDWTGWRNAGAVLSPTANPSPLE